MKTNLNRAEKTETKTSFELPDDCKIVIILDKCEADKLGSLLAAELRRGNGGVASINDCLQNQSYALEDGAWLEDARCSLARGQDDLENEEN